MIGMTVAERTAVDKYELDENCPHIEVDNKYCAQSCTTRPCLTICPAGVYSDKDGEVIAEWAACLECGTCRFACGKDGGLAWQYPRGGFGISYRYA